MYGLKGYGLKGSTTQILTSQGNDKIYLARKLSTHIQGLLLVMLQPCILSVKIETLLYIPVPLGACLAFPTSLGHAIPLSSSLLPLWGLHDT